MSWNQSNGPVKKPANKPTTPSMLKGIAAGLITCANLAAVLIIV